MDIEKQAEELRQKIAEGDEAEEAPAEEAGEESPSEKPKKNEKPKAEKSAEKPADKADDEGDEAEEESAEEGGKPAEKPAEKPEEKKSSNAEAARTRREEAAKRKAEKNKPEEKKPEVTTEEDPEPEDKESIAHANWKIRQLQQRIDATEAPKVDPESDAIKQDYRMRAAKAEFDGHFQRFSKSTPDAGDAITHVYRAVAAGIRALNPHLSDDAVVERANKHMLVMASQFLNEGYENPIGGIYDTAHEKYGYVKADKPAEEQQEQEEPKPKKPDLAKIEEAKKKSTSAATSGGRSSKAKALPDVNTMSAAEYEKLSRAEKEELLEEAA